MWQSHWPRARRWGQAAPHGHGETQQPWEGRTSRKTPPSAHLPSQRGCPVSIPTNATSVTAVGLKKLLFLGRLSGKVGAAKVGKANCQERMILCPRSAISPKLRTLLVPRNGYSHRLPPTTAHPPGNAQRSRISLLAPVSLCASSRAGIIDRAQVPARCSLGDLITHSPRGPN